MSDTARALEVLRSTIPAVDKISSGLRPVVQNYIQLMNMYGFTRSGASKQLTFDEAIQIAGALMCMDIISQDIAKAPLYLYRPLANNGRERVMPGEHPVARLLATRPNKWHTWYEYKEMMLLHLSMLQNAWSAKKMDRRGAVEELIPIMPGRVRTLVNDAETAYLYEIVRVTPHERIQLAGFRDVLREDQIIHFRGRMFDGLFGYSNLDAGAKTLRLNDDLIEFSSRLYRKDGQQPGFFKMPKEQEEALPEEDFIRLRNQLREAIGRMVERNIPVILEQGMEFESFAQNAAEAELSKSRVAALMDIARQFRVPPHKIYALESVKYENMEVMERSYVRDTLIPYCLRMEQRYDAELLVGDDYGDLFIQHDRAALYTQDLKTEDERTKNAMLTGRMTFDEARARDGFNPLPGGHGNARLIPANYSVVHGDTGEVLIPAGAAPGDDGGEPGTGGSDPSGADQGGKSKVVQLGLVKPDEQARIS